MKSKIIFSALSALSAFVLLAFTISSDILPIGSALPKGDLTIKDIEGKTLTLNQAKKKNGLLVMFTCNTCPYVVKNQQRTKAVCKYALQNDIGVVLLNSNEAQRDADDSYDAMTAYAKEQAYEWHYAVDKDNILADEFGASRTPEVFLFNKDLKLSYHGAIDDNPGNEASVGRHYLKEAINGVVKGTEIAVKESRSVGCGIKRKG